MTRKNELKKKVNERIDELIEMVVLKWGKAGVVYPTITYKLKGHTGERANYAREEIMVNYYLLDNNEERYLKNTIGHEYAHLVAYKYFGWKAMRGKPHGKHWKAVMRSLGLNPKRCHSYDTKPARKTRKFLYACADCGKDSTISTVMHNRIRKGRVYRHNGCEEPLKLKHELVELETAKA